MSDFQQNLPQPSNGSGTDPNAVAPKDGRFVFIPSGYEITSDPQPADEQESQSHLWDYIWVVWRYKWLILLVVVTVVGLAIAQLSQAKPIYSAVAALRVTDDRQRLMDFEGERPKEQLRSIDTEIHLLRNRIIAERIVNKYNLYNSTKKKEPSLLDRTKGVVKQMLGSAPRDLTRDEQLQNRVSDFLSNLSVTNLKDTEILKVRFLHTNSETAARVCNSLCKEYITYNFELMSDNIDIAIQWIDDQIEDLKGQLETAEESLLNYAEKEKIVQLAENIDELTIIFEETGQKVAVAEQEMNTARFNLDSFTSGTWVIDPVDEKNLLTLIQSMNQIEIEYIIAHEKYGSEMIEVVQLKSAFDTVRRQVEEEVQRIQQKYEEDMERAQVQLNYEYERSKNRFEFLSLQHDRMRDRLTKVQKGLIQYNILKRDVEVQRELYNSMLERKSDLNVKKTQTATNISIIEEAKPPVYPTYPKKTQTLVIAMFLGLLIGLGMSFFLEYMDTTIHSDTEVERITQHPVLAHLPKIESKAVKPNEYGLATIIEPSSIFAENIRYLRTAIQYSVPGNNPRTILVTSSLPGEGKSTVSANLAVAMAMRGHKTLLIDADMKLPSCHKNFNIERRNGLSDMLIGRDKPGAIREYERVTDLHILPSGSKPPNPVDLLDSQQMRELLTRLSQEFEYIIIDSAPTLDLADSSVLTPYVDGVVIVSRLGVTPRGALRRVTEKLRALHGNILGTVLNNPKNSRYASGSEQYYYGKSKYAYHQPDIEGPEESETPLLEESTGRKT